jgi:RNA polymerase sigma-70 factor (ECF subfamily)
MKKRGESPAWREDLALVERFKAGDQEAFNEIVRTYQKKIYFLCYRMLETHEDAADLSQETFVRAYGALRKFDGRSGLYTWLYRIAMNLCLNQVKKPRSLSLDEEEAQEVEAPSEQGSPEEVLHRSQISQAISRAVEALPPRQKAVFILRTTQGLSHEEIARTINRSVGAVKATYFQAVHKLRESLKELKDI